MAALAWHGEWGPIGILNCIVLTGMSVWRLWYHYFGNQTDRALGWDWALCAINVTALLLNGPEIKRMLAWLSP